MGPYIEAQIMERNKQRQKESEERIAAGLHKHHPAETTTCAWQEDEDGNWETDCGGMHTFIEGGPHENRHAFCPYCGRMLVVVSAG